MTTLNQVAVSAIRLAALTQLGPLAGGLFLSGSDLAKAGAAVLTELTGGAAAGFFQSALQGFSREHNHDLEKSLHQAAKQALQQLRTEISGFDDWFDSWHNYLTRTPSHQLFTTTPDPYSRSPKTGATESSKPGASSTSGHNDLSTRRRPLTPVPPGT